METKDHPLSSLKISELFFYTLLLGILIFAFFMFKPYMANIIITLLIAGFFYPLYDTFVRAFKGRKNLASIITATIILLVIVLPVMAFLFIAFNEAINFGVHIVQQIKNGTISLSSYINLINDILSRIPFVNIRISNDLVVRKLVENSQVFVQAGTDILVTGSKTAVFLFEHITIFLFILYGIFPNFKPLKQKIIELTPLPNEVGRMIIKRVYDMGKAVFSGIVFVGFIQGIIGGIGFLIAGIPGVAFWMLMMIVSAVIPMVGPGFIMIPAIGILLLLGKFIPALIVIVTFLIAINIDNYLRPMLVGRQTSINPILLLVSILGGLKIFGLSGVLLGPMSIVFLLTLLEAYKNYYALKAKV